MHSIKQKIGLKLNYAIIPFTLRWSKKPLSWDNKEKMGLAQYHMIDWDYGNSLDLSRRTGNPLNMSSVYLEFTFKRRTGFFILQVTMTSSNSRLRKSFYFRCSFYI